MASDRIPSPWETIGAISIGDRLSVSDTSYFYDEPVLLSVAPGTYSVMVRYGSNEGTKYVRAMRVARGNNLVRGSRLDHVVVDFGQIGVCDRDAVEKAFDELGDAGMSTYYDQLQTSDLVKTVTLPDNAEMFIARSGFGDGLYPVYLLGASDQMPAGIEIDFEHSIRK
jgi:hypothetical protein